MDNSRFTQLFDRYYQRMATPSEVDAFFTALHSGEFDELLQTLISEYYARFQPSGQKLFPDSREMEQLQHILSRAQAFDFQTRIPTEIRHKRRVRLRAWLPYAAAVLLVASVVGYYVVFNEQPRTESQSVAVEILPGGNRATLTLSDGRTINLSESQTGIAVGDGLTYLDGSKILGNDRNRVDDVLHTMVLTTPKGGTYQVTLPDGSTVWLNANSTLTYPSRFHGDTREVKLEGEAYFSITQLRREKETRSRGATGEHIPFLVKTIDQTVEVLGTEFNISAYADDAVTKTTLVEGKVNVSQPSSNLSELLTPGYQAITHANTHTIQTQKVDVTQYIAWKAGRFIFDGKTFDDVMRELERWYDIDIQYKGGIPTKEFYGDAFRSHNLSVVLSMLESAELEYRLDGRTLTILNKEKK